METPKGFDLLDYLDLLVRKKYLFLKVLLVSLVISYLAVYFFVEEQFEATATLIPREEESAGLASGLLRGMKSLPLGIGAKSASAEIDLYKTIVYSRTMMEDVIRAFDLVSVYKLDTTDIAYMEKAVKRLSKEVGTRETEESAFSITVRASSRDRAAALTNYIVQRMNERIVELRVSRSKQNRVFLEQRIQEIKTQLKASEDSLRTFQERSGLLDAKAQVQGILSAHSTLETELAARRVQEGVLERLYEKGSPQVKEIQLQIEEYQKVLQNLRFKNERGSILLPLAQLPHSSVEFLRRYRDVELNNLLLEFIVPLYEQAKIEEKKDYPILQVIDYAIPPAKKSYPPRVLFSLISAFSVLMIVFFFLKAREAAERTANPRWMSILKQAKDWTWRTRKQA